jgi:hypothetical protein
MVVDPNAVGTANGVVNSLAALMLTIVPPLIGSTLYPDAGEGHKHYGYTVE